MAVSAGAGAALFSGAEFQARVGAYLIALALCESDHVIAMLSHKRIASIGFETAEAIDDLNVSFDDGAAYLQVKTQLVFSSTVDGTLAEILRQFSAHHRSRPLCATDRLVLVTGERASRRITHDLAAALEAFRAGPEAAFRRDQPASLVRILDETIALGEAIDGVANAADWRDIVRKMYVFTLKLEPDASLPQATQLLLASKGFNPAPALWSQLIADCLTYAKTRRTLSRDAIVAAYQRFKSANASPSQKAEGALQFNFPTEGLPAAKQQRR